MRRWCTVTVLIAFALVCARASGADYFVDATTGDDANPGTAAQPWKSLSRLASSIVPGDTASLAGEFRENLKIKNASNCQFRQWAGRAQAILRGDTVVPGNSWRAVSPGVFEHTIPNGTLDNFSEAVATVVVDWDTSIDPQGRHFGHLRRLSTVDEVVAGSDAWSFTGNGQGGGTLRIGLESWRQTVGALDDLTIAYCRANVNGIEIGTPTYDPYPTWTVHTGPAQIGVVIDGLRLYLWADSGYRSHLDTAAEPGEHESHPPGTRSIGYGVRIADGVQCTIRNVVTIDTGYHGLGFVGDSCKANTFEDCEVWGGAPNLYSGNSSYVFYSGPGRSGSDIWGCRGVRCKAFKYTFLDRSAAPIVPQAGCDGMICHTNGVANNRVLDVEWTDCEVVESGDPVSGAGCIGNAFVGGDAEVAPGDPLDWSTYPVRYVRCRVVNGSQNSTSASGHCAYLNCSFRLDRLGPHAAPGMGHVGALSGTASTLFAGCEVVADLARPGAPTALFSCSTENRVLLVNCSVLGKGGASPASDRALFSVSGAATQPVYARGSVFGFTARSVDPQAGRHRLVRGEPGVHAPPGSVEANQYYFDFKDCAYFNLDAFGASPSLDEEIEWRTGVGGTSSNGSVIDPAGIYLGQTVPYADTQGPDLSPTPAFQALVKSVMPHTPAGFNGPCYDGRYGAWQFGDSTVLVTHPHDLTVHGGAPAHFSVEVDSPRAVTYRWRHDGLALVDDGRITGSATPTLTISPTGQGDAGVYDVIVDDTCAAPASQGATLTLRCTADFDADGWVTGDDFDAFMVAFEAGDTPADVDGNTFVNGDDFDLFTAAYDIGC